MKWKNCGFSVEHRQIVYETWNRNTVEFLIERNSEKLVNGLELIVCFHYNFVRKSKFLNGGLMRQNNRSKKVAKNSITSEFALMQMITSKRGRVNMCACFMFRFKKKKKERKKDKYKLWSRFWMQNSCIFHSKIVSKTWIEEWKKNDDIECMQNKSWFCITPLHLPSGFEFQCGRSSFVPYKNREPNERNIAKNSDVHVQNWCFFTVYHNVYWLRFSMEFECACGKQRSRLCFHIAWAYNTFFYSLLFADISFELIKWYYVLRYARKKEWKI